MKESQIRQELSEIAKHLQGQALSLEEGEGRAATDDEKESRRNWVERAQVLEDMLEAKKAARRASAALDVGLPVSTDKAEGEWRGETLPERRARQSENVNPDDLPQSRREEDTGMQRNASLDFDLENRTWMMEGIKSGKEQMEWRFPSAVVQRINEQLEDQGKRSLYAQRIEQRNYAERLAKDGDEVAKRFLRLAGEDRAQMVGSDVLGGYTVPEDDMGLFDTAMKRYNSIERGGIRMFNTSHGRDIPIMTSDDTGNEGEWLAERATSSEGEIEFGRGELRSYAVGSKRIPISFELLRDSSFDILAYIIDMAYIRIGRSKARAMTAGDGQGKPRGAKLDATLSYRVASAANTQYTYSNWVDFFGTLPAAYDNNPVLQISRKSRFDCMKILDNDGRPLWLPSLQPGAPGMILGERYEENDFLDDLGAADRTLAMYGDWMKYYGRTVQMVEVLRYSDSYLSTRAIAVELISFCDGRLVDSGQHPIVRMDTGTAGFVPF